MVKKTVFMQIIKFKKNTLLLLLLLVLLLLFCFHCCTTLFRMVRVFVFWYENLGEEWERERKI